MIHLRFDSCSLLIRGEVGTPYGRWDPKGGAFRAMALHYPAVLEYLDRSRLLYRDEVADPIPIPPLETDVELRPYQSEAIEAWMDAGKRGVIELPTGAWKTFIALKAMERLNMPTLVVVPTLDLMDQCRNQLERLFKVDVGVVGGGEAVLKPLTVSTYDSAYIKAEQLGNRFLFIVFARVRDSREKIWIIPSLNFLAPPWAGCRTYTGS